MDLPVGQNLNDHSSCVGVTFVLENAPSAIPTDNDLKNYTKITPEVYPSVLTSVLSSPDLFEVSGYIKSPFEKIRGDHNDLQFNFVASTFVQNYFNQEVRKYVSHKARIGW